MSTESLKEVGARLQAAIMEAVNAPGMRGCLGIGDLTCLRETLKRYGGRSAWSPADPGAIDQLAPPVRRHIRQLEAEIAKLRNFAN